MLCCAMLCYSILCCAMLCYAVLPRSQTPRRAERAGPRPAAPPAGPPRAAPRRSGLGRGVCPARGVCPRSRCVSNNRTYKWGNERPQARQREGDRAASAGGSDSPGDPDTGGGGHASRARSRASGSGPGVGQRCAVAAQGWISTGSGLAELKGAGVRRRAWRLLPVAGSTASGLPSCFSGGAQGPVWGNLFDVCLGCPRKL